MYQKKRLNHRGNYIPLVLLHRSPWWQRTSAANLSVSTHVLLTSKSWFSLPHSFSFSIWRFPVTKSETFFPKRCIMVPCVKMKAGLRKDMFPCQCWESYLFTWTIKFSSQNSKWTSTVHNSLRSWFQNWTSSYFLLYLCNVLLCAIIFQNYCHSLCVRFHFPIHLSIVFIYHHYQGLYLHWVYSPQNTGISPLLV